MAEYHIVIVDDQADVRRLLRAGLETLKHNFQIEDVPSGEEALLVIANRPIDLLIIDVNLPGISGLELMERARQRNPTMKRILVTGMTDPEIRRQVAEGKADAYFIKPIEMLDFFQAVERCLGTSTTDFNEPQSPKIETPVEDLEARLARLTRELEAQSLLLLDDGGRVMQQAGDLPDAFVFSNLISPAWVALNLGAQISQLLDTNPARTLMSFASAKFDVFLTNVGTGRGLLVITPPHKGTESIAKVYTHLQTAIPDLIVLLANMPLTVSFQDEAVPDVELQSDHDDLEMQTVDLEEIIRQGGPQPFSSDVVDAFWDSAITEVKPKGLRNTGSLSFEQASRLGLAPEEKKP
jgi:CheY-like chemotaxis protein